MLNTECGTNDRCDADLDPTGGEPGTSSGGPDSADTTATADSTGSMGLVPSLEPLYAEVTCEGTTCEIGQPLIDAVLASPEAVLAEGTSLAFASEDGAVVGLEILGVERDGLAGRLGLHDGDVLRRVDELPLRDEGELLAAVEWAYRAERVTVLVERDGVVREWMLVRVR